MPQEFYIDENGNKIPISGTVTSADMLPLTAGSSKMTSEAIGDLSGLTTTRKDSLVDAVNEVNGKIPFVKYEEKNVSLDSTGEGNLFSSNVLVVGIKDIPSDSLYVGYVVYNAGTNTKVKAVNRTALAFTSQGIVSMTRKIGVWYLDNISTT